MFIQDLFQKKTQEIFTEEKAMPCNCAQPFYASLLNR